MNRQFGLTRSVLVPKSTGELALEELAMQEDAAALDVSPIEDAMQMAEASGMQASIAADINDAEKLSDIAASLEEVANIVDVAINAETNTTGMTPAEGALIEVVGDTVAAGSDVPGTDIVPAMEGFIGKKVAVEDFRARAKQIWEQIKAFIKRVWEGIENFFYRHLGAIPRLRKEISRLEEAIDKAHSDGKKTDKDAKVTITAGTAALSVNGQLIGNEADLKKNLGNFTAAADFVYGANLDNIIKRGAAMAGVIGDFDPAKAGDSVKAMLAKMKSTTIVKPVGASGADKNRFPGFESTFGPALLGNVSLVLKEAENDKTDGDLAALAKYRKSGVVLAATSEKITSNGKATEMAPLSLAGAKSALDDLKSLLNAMEDFKRGSRSTGMKKTRAALEAASDKATSAWNASKLSPSDEKAATPQYRALLECNTAYARFAGEPAVSFTSTAQTVVRALLTVIDKSVKAYK